MAVRTVKTCFFDAAFTLTELLVVIFVIGLLAAVVLPSTMSLFTAGADAQAYNALAGQLAAARMLAIQQRTYAGVHAQLADPNGTYTRGLVNTCFTAVVQQDPNGDFILAEGFSPHKMPGSIAFGRVDGPFYDKNTGKYLPNDPNRFACLTFLFAPNGQLEAGKTVIYATDANQPVFFDNTRKTYLWDKSVANHNDCKPSVKAAVMFNYDKFNKINLFTDKDTFLKQYGQMIVVNLYTGTLLGR